MGDDDNEHRVDLNASDVLLRSFNLVNSLRLLLDLQIKSCFGLWRAWLAFGVSVEAARVCTKLF